MKIEKVSKDNGLIRTHVISQGIYIGNISILIIKVYFYKTKLCHILKIYTR